MEASDLVAIVHSKGGWTVSLGRWVFGEGQSMREAILDARDWADRLALDEHSMFRGIALKGLEVFSRMC